MAVFPLGGGASRFISLAEMAVPLVRLNSSMAAALADQDTASRHDEYNNSAVHAPAPRVSDGAHVSSLEQYKEMYDRSIADPTAFWGDMARSTLHWFRDFSTVCV